MKTPRLFALTLLCGLAIPLLSAAEKDARDGAAKTGSRLEEKLLLTQAPTLLALLEKGQAEGEMPEGMVVRLGACLGEPEPGNTADELRESWEFSPGKVHRAVFDYSGDQTKSEHLESRNFETKGVCEALLKGKAEEIRARKGKGPKMGMLGSGFQRGSRSIEVVWKGETILNLHEGNGPALDLYAESDARAFGALYEKLAGQARRVFPAKAVKED